MTTSSSVDSSVLSYSSPTLNHCLQLLFSHNSLFQRRLRWECHLCFSRTFFTFVRRINSLIKVKVIHGTKPKLMMGILLKAGGAPDLSLRPLLVQLLLGLLLQCPDVVHRHPVVPIHPAKHLICYFLHVTQKQCTNVTICEKLNHCYLFVCLVFNLSVKVCEKSPFCCVDEILNSVLQTPP